VTRSGVFTATKSFAIAEVSIHLRSSMYERIQINC